MATLGSNTAIVGECSLKHQSNKNRIYGFLCHHAFTRGCWDVIIYKKHRSFARHLKLKLMYISVESEPHLLACAEIYSRCHAMQIAKFQTRNVLPQVKVILAVMEQLKKLQIYPRKKILSLQLDSYLTSTIPVRCCTTEPRWKQKNKILQTLYLLTTTWLQLWELSAIKEKKPDPIRFQIWNWLPSN